MTLVQCGRQWAASGVGWATSILRGDGVEVHGVEAGCKAVTRCMQGFQGCRTRKTWLEECRERFLWLRGLEDAASQLQRSLQTLILLASSNTLAN